jgi:hypothetical protein
MEVYDNREGITGTGAASQLTGWIYNPIKGCFLIR